MVNPIETTELHGTDNNDDSSHFSVTSMEEAEEKIQDPKDLALEKSSASLSFGTTKATLARRPGKEDEQVDEHGHGKTRRKKSKKKQLKPNSEKAQHAQVQDIEASCPSMSKCGTTKSAIKALGMGNEHADESDDSSQFSLNSDDEHEEKLQPHSSKTDPKTDDTREPSLHSIVTTLARNERTTGLTESRPPGAYRIRGIGGSIFSDMHDIEDEEFSNWTDELKPLPILPASIVPNEFEDLRARNDSTNSPIEKELPVGIEVADTEGFCSPTKYRRVGVFCCVLVVVVAAIVAGSFLALDEQQGEQIPQIPAENQTVIESEPNQTAAPDEDKPICFHGTLDLYDAVDAYVAANGTATNNSAIAETFGWPMGSWCVSGVSDFRELFSTLRNPLMVDFNEDISLWNMSNAQDVSFMFAGAKAFRQDLSGWDMSSVSSMEGLFAEAASFDAAIEHWDVSNVQSMSAMFLEAHTFNRDISNWNVQNVRDVRLTFADATSFTQNLCSWGWQLHPQTPVQEMFSHSGCPTTNDPNFKVSPSGPFCHAC